MERKNKILTLPITATETKQKFDLVGTNTAGTNAEKDVAGGTS